MKRGAAAAASPSTSESLISQSPLIQIEEPETRSDPLAEKGLAVAFELEGEWLAAAASLGGNAERIRGTGGIPGLLPAVAGYDADGVLIAGSPGVADESAVGAAQLADPESTDARGAPLVLRLAALFEAAQLRLVRTLGRPVTHAVVVVPAGAGIEAGMVLHQAVETGGFTLLRLVDATEAAELAPEAGSDAPLLGAAVLAETML